MGLFGVTCVSVLDAENDPQGGPGFSWSSYGRAVVQDPWLWDAAFFFLPGFCLVRPGSQPSFPAVGEQTGSLVEA